MIYFKTQKNIKKMEISNIDQLKRNDIKVSDRITFKLIRPEYFINEVQFLEYFINYEDDFYFLSNPKFRSIFEYLNLKEKKFKTLEELIIFCKETYKFLEDYNYNYITVSSLNSLSELINKLEKPTIFCIYLTYFHSRVIGLLFHFFNQEQIEYFKKFNQELIFCVNHSTLNKFKLLMKRIKDY